MAPPSASPAVGPVGGVEGPPPPPLIGNTTRSEKTTAERGKLKTPEKSLKKNPKNLKKKIQKKVLRKPSYIFAAAEKNFFLPFVSVL